MKFIFYTTIVLFLIAGCSKKEEIKLEAFSPEAFAYDIGDGWEVNSTIRVKGFDQKKDEQSQMYSVSISYTADLVTPADSLIKNIFEDTIHKSDTEMLNDLPLEVQFELDSTYKSGQYKLIYNIKDDNSGKSITNEINFNLAE